MLVNEDGQPWKPESNASIVAGVRFEASFSVAVVGNGSSVLLLLILDPARNASVLAAGEHGPSSQPHKQAYDIASMPASVSFTGVVPAVP